MRTSIPRTMLMALGSALFVVAGAAICAGGVFTALGDGFGTPLYARMIMLLVGLLYFLIGLCAVLFFGFGLLYLGGRLLSFWRPMLEVAPDGILDRASAVGAGYVRWDEVKSVGMSSTAGQRFVAIRVVDERAFLERLNPVKRVLIRINRRYFKGGHINIPMNSLAIPEEELLAEIERCLSHRKEADEKLLASARPHGNATNRYPAGHSVSGPRRSASSIAKSVGIWVVVGALSLVHHVVLCALFIPGVMFAWNGLGPGDAPELDYPVAGAILLVLGVLFFVLFPRLAKKLTGRKLLGPFG